ncbi:hypothetical protein BT93_L3398 [Corymbia citriodora subsp. variegata]|uniref:Uncharacterized protein n=1 Tax=Corymbia citriodora subsp. variegata TaxID=360336 RepID=A0A8T0CJT8_CORYI|nr:hypothetical protein BT93_L3398 [Corymbia citriodora subsp. variegata]
MAPRLQRQIKVFMLMMVSLCAGAQTSADSTLAVFEQWMARHGRIYMNNLEKAKRYEIFLKSFRFIENFNKEGNRSYRVGLNQFSDLTTEEFKARYTGFQAMSKSSKSSTATTFKYQNATEVQYVSPPESANWVDKGVVGDVKDQGDGCGSCWAFSAVGAVESLLAIKKSVFADLSEQQLVDCDKANKGCKGGRMERAFDYISRHGIAYEKDYPYKNGQGNCNETAASASVTKIDDYYSIPVNERWIERSVSQQPVSVAVDGDSDDFKYYKGGIFSGPCGKKLSHAVLIVGYGRSDSDGKNYWLIKNSWGQQWGEKGYMRLQRSTGTYGGICGIELSASHPYLN